MSRSSVRPPENRWFRRRNRPHLTLVTRLSLGFGLVALGVLGILSVSLFSLQQSSLGLNTLVAEALPVKSALSSVRLTIKDISTGAAEHYNAREPQVLSDIRSRVEGDVRAFDEAVSSLVSDYPLLAQDPELKALVAQSVERSRKQFEHLAWNMNTHRRSLEAESRIADVRKAINALRSEASPIFDRYVDQMGTAEAKGLAFRLQRLFDNSALLALSVSLANSLEVIETAQSELRDNLDSVARLTFDILDQQDADAAFADYYSAMSPLFDRIGALAVSNDGLIAQQKVLFEEIRSVLPGKITEVQNRLADISADFLALSERVDAAVGAISTDARERNTVGRNVVISATALILVLCLLISWLVVRSVRRPIQRLSEYMKRVGSGDFTAEPGQYSRDEIGQIFQSTERLVESIREMIARIAELNRDINVISSDTAEATGAVRTRLNDQSDDFASVATAVAQMSASVRDVAQNTRQASDEVAQSEHRAHDIETAINSAVTSNSELSASMTSAVGVIESLDAEVAGIEQILDVIRNIAEQTNLLALNAAIEAARAGEQGRGFAVVADEVRTLASRTQSSTQDIRSKIETVMTGSRDAVDSITASVETASDTSHRVNHVKEAFDDYLTYISRISELNTQVSVAADEQQAVAEDISQRTHAISDRGAVVARDFESTAQRATELKTIASNLNDAISRIRL
ncbi:HAMP domain-containing methyl-accepting chemotaxis protein [Saccharospirillum salsuginis]|uniref:HAMP domain-containing methyl-accepting chemotaxis protein n=1 Tax=Saccharospirillum salsuginis TaxID=418750 RepID=UPI00167332B4|nr:methyl-accepting chemotaxis protein [Saccharospirillum salsuginis]